MERFYLSPTDETPEVILDPSVPEFKIQGNSYPENSTKIYTPILEWLEEYVEVSSTNKIVFDFNFDYFNTSSAKYILEVLRIIARLQDNGKDVLIRWHYFEDDTDMMESGEDYIATVDLPFEMVMREDTF